jgi:hypothetical protein
MKPTVPFEVMMSAKAIKESGNEYRAYPLQIALPDGRGAFRTLVCADVIAGWIVANCDGLPEPERAAPPAPEPPTEPEFTSGYCTATFESYHAGQRHMLYAAWDGGGLIASDQSFPKFPTRRYTAENIATAGHTLHAAWKRAQGESVATFFRQPDECRVYRDADILYVALEGIVWVVPNDDTGRVELFTDATFRDSWLFVGNAPPSNITSRPVAMAAFQFAGLV